MLRCLTIIVLFLTGLSFTSPEIYVKYVLIREVDIGEYDNSRPLSEIILLLNNGKAVFLRDSVANNDLGPERVKKIKSLIGLGSFEKIDYSAMIKRTTDYQINKDSLKIFYLPDNDKSSYFNGLFKPSTKSYNAILFVNMAGKLLKTIDVGDDKVKIYAFKVYAEIDGNFRNTK